jgi:SAM-dependent methyltransferase
MIGARDVAFEIRSIIADYKIDLPFHRTWISLSQYEKSYELVQRHVPPGGTVLDWGAGNGHFGLFLLKCGYRAHAFTLHDSPIYKAFIDAINSRFGNEYHKVQGDPVAHAVSLPYNDASFDGVCSIGVLEHVREFGGNEIGSLREIRRILVPGGIFICTKFPNRTSYVERLRRGHKYLFSLSDIRQMADEAGFELVELGRYQFLPRKLANKLPASLANGALIVGLYNALDGLLSTLFNRLCTCNFFVLRKPV